MKKITTIFLAITALFFLNNNANGQALEQGDINIDVGIGFGLYGTSRTNTSKLTADINGVTTVVSDNKFDTTEGALSTVIPINIEYGLSEKMGIGIDITYNNYLLDSEDKVHLKSVRAYDFGPKFHYHPLGSDFYDLVIGVGGGMSMIKWNFQPNIDPFILLPYTPEPLNGTGFYWNLDIKNKFYFGDHFGAFINLGYKGYFYPSIAGDKSDLEASANSLPGHSNAKIEDDIKWTFHGANIGIGLAVKF